VFESANLEASRIHAVRLVPQLLQSPRKFAIEDLSQVSGCTEHFRRLQRQPLFPFVISCRIREHDVRVQLRIEITACVMD
jgi:hypothetical protein